MSGLLLWTIFVVCIVLGIALSEVIPTHRRKKREALTTNLEDMTRRDFERLPWRDDWAEEMLCEQLVILPAQLSAWRIRWRQLRLLLARVLPLAEREAWEDIPTLHDSGYRCIDYVAITNGQPICRVSGCSDVLHIDGIGGYGYRWLLQGGVPSMVPVAGWQIDCLPRSGVLRIWPSSHKRIIVGSALSSFEIYATDIDDAGWQEHLAQTQAVGEAAIGLLEQTEHYES